MARDQRGSPTRPKDHFVAHLLDLLGMVGGVTARAMFGEYGFFKGGTMFALIWQGNFHVRTDDQNRASHEALGLAQFIYPGRGRPVAMPYFQVPPAALDDPDEMARWARPAIAAAARAAAAKETAKSPRRRSSPRRPARSRQ
jgi:DNA transformation protein